MRIPKVALDTARHLISPSTLGVVADLFKIGMNAHEAYSWIHAPNKELDHHSPMELIITGKEGKVRTHIEETRSDVETEIKAENHAVVRNLPSVDDEGQPLLNNEKPE